MRKKRKSSTNKMLSTLDLLKRLIGSQQQVLRSYQTLLEVLKEEEKKLYISDLMKLGISIANQTLESSTILANAYVKLELQPTVTQQDLTLISLHAASFAKGAALIQEALQGAQQ